jgi:glycosyltransferase involved in cell wall biosynthesis
MRVLFDHSMPFALAHGGFQTQIEQTRTALIELGVDVDWVRWWDAGQKGDIIHFFGRPTCSYIEAAHGKGMKVVIAELLTATGSRSPAALRAQRGMIGFSRRALPASFLHRLAWDTYTAADAVVALTSWEAHLMTYLFGAPCEKLHVVPNGVERVFFEATPASREQWLVCTATITPRKRVVELAEAAAVAETPLWIIGKPYAETDAYAQRFAALVRENPKLLRYEGAVNDRSTLAGVYRRARGFVLLSAMESLSLSALEAAACECPLLLSDLPWARTTFPEGVQFCRVPASVQETATALRRFYDAAPGFRPLPKPPTWPEVAGQLRSLYERLLSTSR